MAKRVRGTFSPEQIQGDLRQGDSPVVLMAKGEFISGNAVVTDADGNAVDSGGVPLVVVGDPEDGEVPTWDEDTSTWVPGEGGGGGGGGDGIPIQINGDEIGAAGVVVETAPPVIGFVINDGSAGANIGPMLAAPRAGDVALCFGVVKASDPSVPLGFDIKRGGVSVFASPGAVAAGVAAGTTFSVTLSAIPLAIAAHDVFSIDITSGSASWQFTAQLEG